VPTANPGARVAEVVLHFRGDVPKRTIVLEHQVSMFYEMAVHNTRDEPPDGSPAAIALSWIDESKEKHVNLVYPVLDLPAGRRARGDRVPQPRRVPDAIPFGGVRQRAAAAPQDPPDSPLHARRARTLVDSEDCWSPRVARRRRAPIYRGGRLSESTLATRPAARRCRVAARRVRRWHRHHRIVPGWRPPCVAVRAADRRRLGRRRAGGGLDAMSNGLRRAQSNSLLGFLLCLLSTPFLLVLLSELLAIATNLRFRLMTVTVGRVAGAARPAVPGAGAGARRGHDGCAAQACGNGAQRHRPARRPEGQGARLGAAVAAALAGARRQQARAGADEAQFVAASRPSPPNCRSCWPASCRRNGAAGSCGSNGSRCSASGAADPSVFVAGDERMANVETPARLDPGVFMQWGVMMIGVRAEETVRGGTLQPDRGRPLDGNLLGAWRRASTCCSPTRAATRWRPAPASRRPTSCCARRWTPRSWRSANGRSPSASRTRSRWSSAVGPARRRPSSSAATCCATCRTRRAACWCIAQPDQRATLDLAVGRIPVRAFFLLVAGSLVVLAAFLSFVVSGRISRPIERLEHGAQALSRGSSTRASPVEDGGQIGRLTRTFNQMAADLQGRLQDLQALNRAMRELSLGRRDGDTLDVLRRSAQAHTAADAVRIVLVEAIRIASLVHTAE
jgi:HAMP domain-containing protein